MGFMVTAIVTAAADAAKLQVPSARGTSLTVTVPIA